MDDHKRIDKGDFLFGIGLAVSEILSDYLESKQDSENDVGTISMVDKGEEVTYDGQLGEIQTICKNEGFQFVATKYFFPLTRKSEDYSVWNNNEFILIKNIDYGDDGEEQNDALITSISRFKQIHDYFNLDEGIRKMNFYIYFPENILIDNDGTGLCKFIVENQWEHHERFGEHDH